jgi:hypothetical protein
MFRWALSAAWAPYVVDAIEAHPLWTLLLLEAPDLVALAAEARANPRGPDLKGGRGDLTDADIWRFLELPALEAAQ